MLGKNRTQFISLIIVSLLGMICIIRILICDIFLIPSGSMSPTLNAGDIICVNKTLMGPRIYKKFDFRNNDRIACKRLNGIRNVRPGDVICFNDPHGYEDMSRIEFKINNVYCKRVLGTPGDRIGAVDGHYWNDKVLRPIGVLREQENLRWMFDSLFIWNQSYAVLPRTGLHWNIKNWGPVIVPEKGMTVRLDESNRELYRQVIEYESETKLDISLDEYTFKGNYYFAVGDNAMNSNDSRYWGFIPEDFIIGIVGGKKVRNNPYQTGGL